VHPKSHESSDGEKDWKVATAAGEEDGNDDDDKVAVVAIARQVV